MVWHNDHSRPEAPKVRALDEEIARIVRARVVNPKWIKGVMRHGYKGGFEMAARLPVMPMAEPPVMPTLPLHQLCFAIHSIVS